MWTILVRLIEVYFLIGIVFSIYFVIKGIGKIDPNAAKGSWGFRIMVIPG